VGSLALAICRQRDWRLSQIRFYTGVPDREVNPRWHSFWQRKLAVMGTRGIWSFTRPLRYRNEVAIVDGLERSVLVGREKGVDVRLALDVIRLASRREFEVAVLFSQGPGSVRGRGRGAGHLHRASALAQGRQRSPCEPHVPQQAGHQRHRLDPTRSRDLRRLHRPSRLSVADWYQPPAVRCRARLDRPADHPLSSPLEGLPGAIHTRGIGQGPGHGRGWMAPSLRGDSTLRALCPESGHGVREIRSRDCSSRVELPCNTPESLSLRLGISLARMSRRIAVTWRLLSAAWSPTLEAPWS